MGESYDNAMAETIHGLYRMEAIRKRRLRCNVDAVEYATLQWVNWFNNKRLLKSLCWVPPVE